RGPVTLTGLAARFGYVQVRLDPGVVEDVVRPPRLGLLGSLRRKLVEDLLQDGDVLLAVVDELLPLLRLLLRGGELPVPVRLAEQVDQPGARRVLDGSAERLRQPVQGQRVTGLGSAGHRVDPPSRLDVRARRQAELSTHADPLELSVVGHELVSLVSEQREELVGDLLLPHRDLDGSVVYSPGDHEDLEVGRLGVSVDVRLLQVDAGSRLDIHKTVGHQTFSLPLCPRAFWWRASEGIFISAPQVRHLTL